MLTSSLPCQSYAKDFHPKSKWLREIWLIGQVLAPHFAWRGFCWHPVTDKSKHRYFTEIARPTLWHLRTAEAAICSPRNLFYYSLLASTRTCVGRGHSMSRCTCRPSPRCVSPGNVLQSENLLFGTKPTFIPWHLVSLPKRSLKQQWKAATSAGHWNTVEPWKRSDSISFWWNNYDKMLSALK